MSQSTSTTALAQTPLHALHRELGATLVAFAGYDMPVKYPAGIIKEHRHTRDRAGLFDVSHMGQARLTGPAAAAALEALVPGNIVDLGRGRQRYTLFTNERGGILDDFMVTNAGDHLFLVVNAACKAQDFAHVRTHIPEGCALEELTDRALLALQGPAAGDVLSRLGADTGSLAFMSAANIELAGADCFITRSGYTGEDGFEISVPAEQAEKLARRLLEQDEVAPVGLGARDSLRLEAGLCLYGHDIDTTTTPIEAGLTWAISKKRRADGERAGGFPGADVILRQIADGVARRRVGVLPQSRVPVREGAELVDEHGTAVGRITSGGFGPTAGAPVAMGYVTTSCAEAGTELAAIVRGKPVPVKVAAMPFVSRRYVRKS